MENNQLRADDSFLASFSAERRRIVGHAAKVLGAAPPPEDPAQPLYGVLLASLEEVKVAEEELIRQNQSFEMTCADLTADRDRFRALFEHAPAALLLTDTTGGIRQVNRAASALLGSDPYYLEGKPIAVLVPRVERTLFREALSRLPIVTNVTKWHFHLERRGNDPVGVRAAVHVISDRQLGSALYWHVQVIDSADN